MKFRQNLVKCFFLRRSIFSFFSFLPHIFLVIDCQWSFSTNRHEHRTISTMLFEKQQGSLSRCVEDVQSPLFPYSSGYIFGCLLVVVFPFHDRLKFVPNYDTLSLINIHTYREGTSRWIRASSAVYSEASYFTLLCGRSWPSPRSTLLRIPRGRRRTAGRRPRTVVI